MLNTAPDASNGRIMYICSAVKMHEATSPSTTVRAAMMATILIALIAPSIDF